MTINDCRAPVCLAGVFLIAGGLQGYVVGIGDLGKLSVPGWIARALIIASGLLLAVPGGSLLIPYGDIELALAALIAGGCGIAIVRWTRSKAERIVVS